MFKSAAIVGLGLIGGSFALDLKRVKAVEQIFGYEKNLTNCQKAVEVGIADQAFQEWNDKITQADLVVLAVPVGANQVVMETLHPWIRPESIVTDVGSVKTPILELMTKTYPQLTFVAGHPISGGETFGPTSARTHLFENKKFILTPNSHTGNHALNQIQQLWERLGSIVHIMDADTHDKIFASVSHLPHLLAYAAIDALGHADSPDILGFFGGGLKDFSRIAASSPQMWADIFLENQTHLLDILQKFRNTLDVLESAISSQDHQTLKTHLAESKKLRDDWITANN